LHEVLVLIRMRDSEKALLSGYDFGLRPQSDVDLAEAVGEALVLFEQSGELPLVLGHIWVPFKRSAAAVAARAGVLAGE
jgi:hypothetical protein